MRQNLTVLLLSTAAIALSFGAGPARAQTSTGSGASGIEEVTVTAERRSELLSKVPASISAYTADKMETLNVKNFSDLAKYTPGVTFDQHSDNISIRGINSSAGDATTGIYIDDTPIQLRTLGFGSDNTLPAVFDLQRVEVLRGPQGTLFGAGSEGGTVRYITPAPSLTDYSVIASSEVSSTQDGAPSYEAGAAVGGPIVDDVLGFRVSAWYRHDGGYINHVDPYSGKTIDNNDNYSNTFAGRAAFSWQVTPDLNVTPSVFYQNRRVNNDDEYWVALSNPSSGKYINETPERMGDRDRFTLPALKVDWTPAGSGIEVISDTSYFQRHQSVQDYSGTLYNLSYFQQSMSNPGFYDMTQGAPTVPGNPLGTYVDPDGVACSGGLCAANTAATHANPAFIPTPLLGVAGINLPGFGPYKSVNYITNTQANFTQELRVQSDDPDARLVWVVGAFYSRQSQLSIEEINDPQLAALSTYLWGDPSPSGCEGPTTGDVLQDIWCEDLLPNGDDYINHTNGHEKQFAGYANATFAVTPQIKVQAGARYAATHFDFSNYSDGSQNFGPLTGNSGHQNERPFTPMAGITYQVNDDDMVYFTWAKGYRIGGANPPFPASACTELSTSPGAYNSDTVTSYELGSKDRMFDGRLQASGSIYYLNWNNIQQDNYLPSCGFKYTTNQGTATSKGFDLEAEWLATDNLDFNLSLGYVDAYYTSSPVAAGLLLAHKGDKLPGSPWTFTLGAQYNFDSWGTNTFLRADYSFQSRETGLAPNRDPYTDPVYGNIVSYDPALRAQPQIDELQMRAGTTFGNTAVAIFADNLLNAHPQLNYSHQDSDTLLFEATTVRPRTIGISATYKY
jgi:outer membrane receptor protein involved in Fe transport